MQVRLPHSHSQTQVVTLASTQLWRCICTTLPSNVWHTLALVKLGRALVTLACSDITLESIF